MTDYARASQFYRRYQYPDEREVAVVRKNGSLKSSNAGEWRFGFTKMTDYARASQCYCRCQHPDKRKVAVVYESESLKSLNAGEWRLGFTKMTDYARASQCYRQCQDPDEKTHELEVVVVHKSGSEVFECWRVVIGFQKDDRLRASKSELDLT